MRNDLAGLLGVALSLGAGVAGAASIDVDSIVIVRRQFYPLPLPGYTAGSAIYVILDGEFNTLEIAETADFSGARSEPHHPPGERYFFDLADVKEGPNPIFLRATDAEGSVTVETSVFGKATGPGVPGVPTDAGDSVDGNSVTFNWAPASDPVGKLRYECAIQWNFPTPLLFQESTSREADTTSVTLELPSSAVARCQVRAIDAAGNAGAWSEFSDGITINPGIPALLRVNLQKPAVNVPVATFQHEASGTRAVVQMAENPEFTDAQERPEFNTWVDYNFGDVPDGPHTIYHRLKGPGGGVSRTLTSAVFLDRVAPPASTATLVENFGRDGELYMRWKPPVDPAPSSGVHLTGELVRPDGAIVPESYIYFPVNEQGGTVSLPYGVAGGQLRLRAVTKDLAGNASAPMISEPFQINAKPTAPIITLPDNIYSGDFIIPIISSIDPDGDAIDYQVEYYRYTGLLYPPYEELVYEGPYLSPRKFASTIIARAVDSRGGVSLPTVKDFALTFGLPSAPEVTIYPQAPPAGYTLNLARTKDSIDPDGDTIRYRIEWSKAEAEGLPLTHLPELDGLEQVPGSYVGAGSFWKAIVTPYQTSGSPDGRVDHVDGSPASATVGVSTAANLPPVVAIEGMTFFVPQSGEGPAILTVSTSSSDPEEGAITQTLHVISVLDGKEIFQSGPSSGGFGSAEYRFHPEPGVAYAVRVTARDDGGLVSEAFQPIPETVGPAVGWQLE